MRALLQRVTEASVVVEDVTVGRIGKGLLVFLGVMKGDDGADVEYMAKKISNLRIFEDAGGKMNLSVSEAGGGLLIVSQFTLAADCKKGNRPSFDHAEDPQGAELMYNRMVSRLSQEGIPVASGRFAAYMQVHLVNDGPVTIFLDSKKDGH